MLYRKIVFYIFRLPHQLFHLLWKLSRMSGGHLEKLGRPVVLENVSGGHFEKKKKKKAPPPSFFPQRQDAKYVLFFYFALSWIEVMKCSIFCNFQIGAVSKQDDLKMFVVCVEKKRLHNSALEGKAELFSYEWFLFVFYIGIYRYYMNCILCIYLFPFALIMFSISLLFFAFHFVFFFCTSI